MYIYINAYAESICQHAFHLSSPQSQEARTEAAGCGHPKGSGSAKNAGNPTVLDQILMDNGWFMDSDQYNGE